MDVSEILDQLKKLIEEEKIQNSPEMEKQVAMLQDAIDNLERFAENKKVVASEEKPMVSNLPKSNEVVDTNVLTGPIGGLKNFLLKTQRDNESQ